MREVSSMRMRLLCSVRFEEEGSYYLKINKIREDKCELFRDYRFILTVFSIHHLLYSLHSLLREMLYERLHVFGLFFFLTSAPEDQFALLLRIS